MGLHHEDIIQKKMHQSGQKVSFKKLNSVAKHMFSVFPQYLLSCLGVFLFSQTPQTPMCDSPRLQQIPSWTKIILTHLVISVSYPSVQYVSLTLCHPKKKKKAYSALYQSFYFPIQCCSYTEI